MDLLTLAGKFIQEQDVVSKEEYYETAAARTEDVLCKFMRSIGLSLWRVYFTWENEDNFKTYVSYFILEDTASKYLEESLDRFKTSPLGSPTRHEKVFGGPNV